MKKRALEAINTIIFVCTILGTNAIDLFGLQVGQTEKIAASVILVLVYLLVVKEKRFERLHSLPEDSRKFSRFFRKWYSRTGKLIVFCTNLEWLDRPRHGDIVEALKKKGSNLHLYLRSGLDERIAQTLVRSGAVYHRVKHGVETSHRFSILVHNGIQSIIIRNKDIRSDRIVFIETDSYQDPYLISLAHDMLRNCDES